MDAMTIQVRALPDAPALPGNRNAMLGDTPGTTLAGLTCVDVSL